MKLSVVIPLKDGSKETELYYAVLSIKKHLKNIGDIFVVTSKKPQTQGLNWICCKDLDKKNNKERSIYNKIVAAINDERVTDDFVFTNDDIFLNKNFDALNLPLYHKGQLYETMIKQNSDYRKSLNHSRKYLINNNFSTYDFDIHFPIVYNKKLFLQFTKKLDWDIEYGYVIKSIYGNQLNADYKYISDCKLNKKFNYNTLEDIFNKHPFISTDNGLITDELIQILKDKYDS